MFNVLKHSPCSFIKILMSSVQIDNENFNKLNKTPKRFYN